MPSSYPIRWLEGLGVLMVVIVLAARGRISTSPCAPTFTTISEAYEAF